MTESTAKPVTAQQINDLFWGAPSSCQDCNHFRVLINALPKVGTCMHSGSERFQVVIVGDHPVCALFGREEEL